MSIKGYIIYTLAKVTYDDHRTINDHTTSLQFYPLMTHLSSEQIHLQELALVPRGQIGLRVQEQHRLTWFHLDSGHQHNGLCFRLKQKNPEITEINLVLAILISILNSLQVKPSVRIRK